MYRSFALVFFCSIAAFAQTAASDSVTQALLNEVRLLRQDLQAVTAASQRVQIILFRLQAQQSAVSLASQQHQAAQAQLTGAERVRAEAASQIEGAARMRDSQSLPADKSRMESLAAELKDRLAMSTAQLNASQVRESDAATRLRLEQAKLDDLQGTLDRLDKAMEGLLNKR